MKLSVLFAALALVSASASWNAFAGEGHDHGDEGPVVAGGNGPQRQADGSVFLPKPAQRQIGVRTLVTEAGELPRTTALAGKVVMDPNAGGKVQAMVAGRLEAGPQGLPSVGQAVKKGDVLAYVSPSTDQIERSNQMAQLAELHAARALVEKRLARLKELADTVPRKEIEAAESDASAASGPAAPESAVPLLANASVDKTDIEVEGLLLEVLSDFQVTIPELGTITAVRRPLVLLTSNATRELSEAIKRRCLFLYIDYPDAQREKEILLSRVPEADEALATAIVEVIGRLRMMELKKAPSIAETIDWARTLVALQIGTLDAAAIDQTLGVILKHASDQARAIKELRLR